MYEICALLASRKPKVRKPRAPSSKPIKVGVKVLLFDKEAVVVERDSRFANAWFVELDGVRPATSFGRDMLVVL